MKYSLLFPEEYFECEANNEEEAIRQIADDLIYRLKHDPFQEFRIWEAHDY